MTWDKRPLVKREGSPSRRAVLNLTESTLAALDRLSEQGGVSRSEVVRNLIRDADAATTREEAWTRST